jgi:aminoglycoside/choline kinase family phosphotransferase
MTESNLPSEAAALVRDTVGEDWTVEPLPGDASVRAYYRIRRPDGSSVMLTWYPAEVREQLGRFLRAYEAVSPHAPVPEVIRASDSSVLQRDVGDRDLFTVLRENRDEGIRLYRDAIGVLKNFQKANADINPSFTADFFFNELEMTREFYVEKLAKRDATPVVPLLREIAERVASHPYVLCHRDFHGENLHVVNGQLFVIDYQDMRMGPDTYDLASLLRDRGVVGWLGMKVEIDLVDAYGCPRHRYYEALLQRSIKILGTWAKQYLTRGKERYLDFIAPTLESIHRCIEELPEFRKLGDVFP